MPASEDLRLTFLAMSKPPLPESTPAVAAIKRWTATRPVHRGLGSSLVTIFTVAGALLSVGGFASLIGIGQTQISASRGGNSSIWADGWFIAGFVIAGLGVVSLAVAIAASISQARARRGFPDLSVAITGIGAYDPKDNSDLKQFLQQYPMRITNRERDRNASLGFTLYWNVKPDSIPGSTEWPFFPPNWRLPELSEGFLVHEVRLPWHIPPGTTQQGDLFFEFPSFIQPYMELQQAPRIEIVDHNSGRSVSIEVESAGQFDSRSWRKQPPK
jgi:hypothetical protein